MAAEVGNHNNVDVPDLFPYDKALSFVHDEEKEDDKFEDFDDDDDSSTDEEDSQCRSKRVILALMAYQLIKKSGKKNRSHRQRRKMLHRNRQKACSLLQEGIDDGLFKQEYRMGPASFQKLVDLLRDDLRPHNTSQTRCDFIDPETKVMMTLRWLAGGQYVDQCRRNGVSKPAFFRCAAQVINAINRHPDIGNPKWPRTIDDCDEIAQEWAKLSGPHGAKGLLMTVIGMLDGILVKTISPSMKETKRPDDYRSGHKKAIGLNVQAMCDASFPILFSKVPRED